MNKIRFDDKKGDTYSMYLSSGDYGDFWLHVEIVRGGCYSSMLLNRKILKKMLKYEKQLRRKKYGTKKN